jgi:hypothetical protein
MFDAFVIMDEGQKTAGLEVFGLREMDCSQASPQASPQTFPQTSKPDSKIVLESFKSPPHQKVTFSNNNLRFFRFLALLL